MMILLLCSLFFLSDAAALVYEVAWVRSLSLVFGGSHLAVTKVLAVFVAGLAIRSWWLGRIAERSQNLLCPCGFLEIGIAASAAAGGRSPQSGMFLSRLRTLVQDRTR